MKLRTFLPILAVVLLAVALPAQAETVEGQLEQVAAAYERGDYAAAYEKWQPLAQQGNADAQHNLGLMYVNGQGVPQDLRKARELWQQAAQGNNAEARQHALIGLRQLDAMGK